MFQPLHLIFLAFTALFVPFFCQKIQENSQKTNAFLRFSAVILLLFDPIYWVWEWNTTGKIAFATSLPLYLCSLFWMLLPVAVFAKPGRAKQTALANLCTFGLLGGVLGLVFNVYLNQYPFFSFVPLRSLLYHFMMILVSVLLWRGQIYQPKAGDLRLALLPVGLLLIPCYFLNRLYGWDYCYMAGGRGTPLTFLSAGLPQPIFLAVLYGGLTLVIYLLFYARHKKTEPAETTAEISF